MGKDELVCECCGDRFTYDPRVKNQRYCSKPECQRARRTRWQRQKMKKDKEYHEDQQRCKKEWQENHPDYWKKYRKKNPDYVARNRERQQLRDIRRRKDGLVKVLAKMDVITRPHFSRRGGLFKLIPQDRRLLAKMDALTVKLIPVEGVRSYG